MNFYRNDGYNWPNYLLYFMWGKIFGSHQWSNGQRNMLQRIYNQYINNEFSNSGVLSSGYSNGYPGLYSQFPQYYPNDTNNNSPITVNPTEADGIKCIDSNSNYTNKLNYGCDLN